MTYPPSPPPNPSTPKSKGKIRLYTFYNASFMRLKDRFLSTIKDDYEIHCLRSDFETGGLPIHAALDMFIARGKIICDAIRDNMGKIIVLADIDIQFFNPTEPFVRKALESNDIVFQKGEVSLGHAKYNMGFIALHCTPAMLAFWYEVLQEIRDTGRWEETIINEKIVLRQDIRTGVFPEQIWTPVMKSRPYDIALHHAICAGITEKGKLGQMIKVSKAIARGTFGKLAIEPADNGLISQIKYLNTQRKTLGNRKVLTEMLPQTLHAHLIAKNIGRAGKIFKKIFATLLPANSTGATLQLALRLAKAEFKMRNEGSYLGIVWYLLNPILTFLILLAVFAYKLGANIEHYALYLFLGIIIFNQFQATTIEATKSILREYHHLIKSINFPRESLILSIVLKNIFTHAFEILLFAALLIYFNAGIIGIAYYIPILLLTSAFVYGTSLILSSITVYFADMDNIWNFASKIIWFGTPIFYAIEGQTKLLQLNLFNPMYYLITLARETVIYHRMPSPLILWGSVGLSIGIWLLGMIVFRKLKYNFAESV